MILFKDANEKIDRIILKSSYGIHKLSQINKFIDEFDKDFVQIIKQHQKLDEILEEKKSNFSVFVFSIFTSAVCLASFVFFKNKY